MTNDTAANFPRALSSYYLYDRDLYDLWFVLGLSKEDRKILLFLVKNWSFRFTNKFILVDIEIFFQTNEFYLYCFYFSKSETGRRKIKDILEKHVWQLWQLNEFLRTELSLSLSIISLRLSRNFEEKSTTTRRSAQRASRRQDKALLQAQSPACLRDCLPLARGRSLPLANPRDGRIWTSWQLLRRPRWNI